MHGRNATVNIHRYDVIVRCNAMWSVHASYLICRFHSVRSIGERYGPKLFSFEPR